MTESLWDVLQGRTLPTQDVPIPRDPTAHAAAEQAVEAASRALQVAHSRGADGEALAPLVADVEAAQQALDGQPVIVFTVRCIPAGDWEALAAAHPPTPEQRKQGWQWNITTFRPAVLADAVTPALSEHQWHAVAETGKVGLGELDLLFGSVVALNNRSPQVSVGKG